MLKLSFGESYPQLPHPLLPPNSPPSPLSLPLLIVGHYRYTVSSISSVSVDNKSYFFLSLLSFLVTANKRPTNLQKLLDISLIVHPLPPESPPTDLQELLDVSLIVNPLPPDSPTTKLQKLSDVSLIVNRLPPDSPTTDLQELSDVSLIVNPLPPESPTTDGRWGT